MQTGRQVTRAVEQQISLNLLHLHPHLRLHLGCMVATSVLPTDESENESDRSYG